ncbi:AraC family transcriptional regulator [Brucella sp. 21LCYQ03]|nr:AraC family transcriptional regulator [Brucella sp. 21LCYQ03]
MKDEIFLSTNIIGSTECINFVCDIDDQNYNIQDNMTDLNKEDINSIKYNDCYVIFIITSGKLCLDKNKDNVMARPGDIVIMDGTHVISRKIDNNNFLTTVVPKYELEKRVNWQSLHGTILKAQAPTTGLLFNYIKGMADVSRRLNVAENNVAREAMILLLASSIKDALCGITSSISSNSTVRSRVLALIDENFTNPQFRAGSILEHFHVSRSHIYRAFESEGGLAKIIREKRVKLAHQLLVETRGKQLSLKEIAFHCGFQDTSQFTQAFKKKHGTTPSKARAGKGASKKCYTSAAEDFVS